jgi:hypothetical protein
MIGIGDALALSVSRGDSLEIIGKVSLIVTNLPADTIVTGWASHVGVT